MATPSYLAAVLSRSTTQSRPPRSSSSCDSGNTNRTVVAAAATPVVMVVEFNDLARTLCSAYCIPIRALSAAQLRRLLAADHRLYSDAARELAKDGCGARDPVHEAMRVIGQV